jgi:hypothetical protein
MTDKTKDKIKVIYCMGSGRSGSTLLGMILANHPDCFNPGELNDIGRLSQEGFRCSCGEAVSKCSFWSDVYNRWVKKSGPSHVEQYLNTFNKIENFKSSISWYKAFLKYKYHNNLLNNYTDITYNFYKSISEISGKSIIVDISKNPLRAFLLSLNSRIDLRLMHMVRDGRGVAWSLNKFIKPDFPQKKVWRTAVFWTIVNRQSSFVSKRVSKSQVFKYEDLAESPEVFLKTLSKLAEITAKPLVETVTTGNIVHEESHIMAGNRLRRSKSIIIKIDSEWKEKMSVRKQRIFALIASKTLKKFNYK